MKNKLASLLDDMAKYPNAYNAAFATIEEAIKREKEGTTEKGKRLQDIFLETLAVEKEKENAVSCWN